LMIMRGHSRLAAHTTNVQLAVTNKKWPKRLLP